MGIVPSIVVFLRAFILGRAAAAVEILANCCQRHERRSRIVSTTGPDRFRANDQWERLDKGNL